MPYFTKTWSDDDLPIDILLLAVESRDFLSCFSFQDQLLKIYKSELGYVYFGNMGDASDQEKVKVALVNCSKGVASAGGSLIVESRDFLSYFSLQDQLLKIYNSELGYVCFGNMGDAKDQEKVKLALLNCSIGATTQGAL